jgi:DNA-binding NarL/FixJ family response regulator
VDDSQPFRQTLLTILRDKHDLGAILEAQDGVEAVQLARVQRPDLILLDLQLPKLNGIDAARQIRQVSPQSKILVVTQEVSVDIVQAVFSAGALGYVVKMDAGRELPTAVRAVLRGERFVGPRFAGHSFSGSSDARIPEG